MPGAGPPVSHDTGRAAVGRASSFNSGKNVTVLPVVNREERGSSRLNEQASECLVRPARPLISSTWTRAPRGTSSGAGRAHSFVGAGKTRVARVHPGRRRLPRPSGRPLISSTKTHAPRGTSSGAGLRLHPRGIHDAVIASCCGHHDDGLSVRGPFLPFTKRSSQTQGSCDLSKDGESKARLPRGDMALFTGYSRQGGLGYPRELREVHLFIFPLPHVIGDSAAN